MKNNKKKMDEKLPPEVEHFCSILASIAVRVAGRCEQEKSILNENANAFERGDQG